MLSASSGVMLNTVAAQLIGFLRTAVIAASLGAALEVDAYYISVLVPGFISTVVVSWLQVGFVGRYAGLVAVGDAAGAKAYRSRMLLLVSLIGTLATALCILVPQWVMSVLLPAGQHQLSAAAALSVCGVILVPIIVGDFIGLVLNCHGRFFAASAAPVANAAVSVLGLWLWPTVDLSALLGTLIMGSVVQLAVVVASISAMRLGFKLDGRSAKGEVRGTVLIAMPLLPAILLSNAVTATLQLRSAELGEGAVAILSYAQRLNSALTQVVVIGLGTVLLPYVASLLAKQETEKVVDLLRRIARVSVLVSSYFLCGVYLFGEQAVGALFVRGSFDVQLAKQVAEIWTILTLSLLPFALGTFIAKVSQALRRPTAILFSSVLLYAATWGMSFWGSKAQSLEIIALSFAVSFSVTAVFWLIWLSRALGAKGVVKDVALSGLRVIPVLLPAILLDLLVRQIVEPLPQLIEVGLRGLTYTLLAAGLVHVLGLRVWFLGRISHDSRVGS